MVSKDAFPRFFLSYDNFRSPIAMVFAKGRRAGHQSGIAMWILKRGIEIWLKKVPPLEKPENLNYDT